MPSNQSEFTDIRWMFDCCRLPGPEGYDWSVSYAKEGDLGDSGHIAVIRKNKVWKIDAAIEGRILSTEEFERWVLDCCEIAYRSD
jgi:carnitine O-acetyltransferase